MLAAAPLAVGCGSSRANVDAGATPATDSGADGPEAPGCRGDYQGSVEDYPNDSWHVVGNGAGRVVVARDDTGLYAYSARCTHGDCDVALVDAFGRTRCPCHGAEFDGNGQVTRGPATVDLPHVAVAVCGRRVFVDVTTAVPATMRVVP